MPPARQEPAPGLQLARAGRFATPRVRLFVPSAGWGGRRRRELLLGAALVAVLFHVAIVAVLVEAPGLMPAFLRAPPPKEPPPPPEAELVMVKQDTPTVGGTPPPQKAPAPAPRADPQEAQASGAPSSTLDAPDGPVAPASAQSRVAAPGRADAAPARQPTPPPASPASTVQVNLDLDGQPGWGLVDPRTIAASPDDRSINKPAAYPRAAAERGEEGTVYLLTLIAPDGRPLAVQIEQSSGLPGPGPRCTRCHREMAFPPGGPGGSAG